MHSTATPVRLPRRGSQGRDLLERLAAKLGTDPAMLVAIADDDVPANLLGNHPAGGSVILGTLDQWRAVQADFVDPGPDGYAARERAREAAYERQVQERRDARRARRATA